MIYGGEQIPFDLRDILRDVSTLIEVQAVERGITFNYKPEEGQHWKLIGSLLHLRQIFWISQKFLLENENVVITKAWNGKEAVDIYPDVSSRKSYANCAYIAAPRLRTDSSAV